MLDDLTNNEKIRPHVRELYKQRVKSLSDSLKRAELSDLCRLVAPYQATAPGPLPTAHAAPAAQSTAAANGGTIQRAPLAPVAVPKKLPPAPGAGAAPIKPIALSDAAKARLTTQGKVHEALTDELVDMASALKTNTLAMEAKVKERGELLDGTEAALENSVAGTKASAAKATEAHRRGRINFCFTILVMFIIGTGFAAMYIFIRITSLTGYKAAKAPIPVPTPVPIHPPDLDGTHTEL